MDNVALYGQNTRLLVLLPLHAGGGSGPANRPSSAGAAAARSESKGAVLEGRRACEPADTGEHGTLSEALSI
jgi:hypothetical protein